MRITKYREEVVTISSEALVTPAAPSMRLLMEAQQERCTFSWISIVSGAFGNIASSIRLNMSVGIVFGYLMFLALQFSSVSFHFAFFLLLFMSS